MSNLSEGSSQVSMASHCSPQYCDSNQSKYRLPKETQRSACSSSLQHIADKVGKITLDWFSCQPAPAPAPPSRSSKTTSSRSTMMESMRSLPRNWSRRFQKRRDDEYEDESGADRDAEHSCLGVEFDEAENLKAGYQLERV